MARANVEIDVTHTFSRALSQRLMSLAESYVLHNGRSPKLAA